MTLLVAGADHVDAGKTTFSTGLLARTNAVGFKPRAGNDYWFNHDDYQHALDEGTLFGKDARRLAAASPGTLDPRDINPIHRLWQPAPDTTGMLGQHGREFLLDRAGERYICNGTATLPEEARQRLPLSDAVVVETLEAFNQVMQRHHRELLDSFAQTIQATDRAVVESYSDVARPIHGLEPDGVAVVEPTRVRLFDGERYRKTCQVASGSAGSFHGQLEERVDAVIDLVEPVETVTLPPLTKAERREPSAVADAYEQAYDALLSVADWTAVV